MRILALDPGTSCGWAVSDGPSGTWDLAPARGDSPGMRYIRLRARLEETLRAFPDLGLVAFERAHHRGGAATEIGVGLMTHIQSWCAERKIEHIAVHSMTLKKWATGSGKAKKHQMRAAWIEKHPVKRGLYRSEDEIDALWILAWTLDSVKHQWSGVTSCV